MYIFTVHITSRILYATLQTETIFA